jgi:hypothetical protein
MDAGRLRIKAQNTRSPRWRFGGQRSTPMPVASLLTVAKGTSEAEGLAITTIRTLCMDAVQLAESGHPGSPMGTVVLNDLDRFHLVKDVIDRLPQLGARAAHFKQALRDKLIEHKSYVRKHGDDMPEIAGWRWGLGHQAGVRGTSTEGDNV